MLELIDGHAHLHEIEPVAPVIAKASASGVKCIVAVGMDLETNQKTLLLAKRNPGTIYPAIGYHPWSIKAEDVDMTLGFIEANLADCVAAGEVGLDYRVKVSKSIQRDVFSKIIKIAKTKEKPLIIHTRFSQERAFRMVTEAGVKKAVFHWYSGPEAILEKIIEGGFFVSATPALKYSKPHSAAISRAPLDNILIETDAPVKYQYKASEPADLLDTVRLLARLKGISVQEAAAITTRNAKRLYQFD